MIRLFHFEGYEVEVDPEALTLAPFKEIWDRDNDKYKSIAKQELAYIYYMADPRSDYQYLIDSDVRSSEIIKGLGMPKKWKPDNIVKKALAFYSSFKPTSAGLLEDTRAFVDAFRKELRERAKSLSGLEFKELKEALSIVKQIPSMSKDLDEAERTLNKDIIAEMKARGSQQKSILEDEN